MEYKYLVDMLVVLVVPLAGVVWRSMRRELDKVTGEVEKMRDSIAAYKLESAERLVTRAEMATVAGKLETKLDALFRKLDEVRDEIRHQVPVQISTKEKSN